MLCLAILASPDAANETGWLNARDFGASGSRFETTAETKADSGEIVLKGCNAVGIRATERVLIENVHARHMATEAFNCQGPSRTGKSEPKAYIMQLTYLRCR